MSTFVAVWLSAHITKRSHGSFQIWKSCAWLAYSSGDRALYTQVRNKRTMDIKVAKRSYSEMQKKKLLLNKRFCISLERPAAHHQLQESIPHPEENPIWLTTSTASKAAETYCHSVFIYIIIVQISLFDHFSSEWWESESNCLSAETWPNNLLFWKNINKT